MVEGVEDHDPTDEQPCGERYGESDDEGGGGGDGDGALFVLDSAAPPKLVRDSSIHPQLDMPLSASHTT